MASKGRRLTVIFLAAVAAWTSCVLHDNFHAFIGSSSGSRCGSDSIARSAYNTILRRDPWVNKRLQSYGKQAIRLETRQAGQESLEVDVKLNAKVAKLRSLGLFEKADELEANILAKRKVAWHLNHPAVGEVWEGYLDHPDLQGGARVDIALVLDQTDPSKAMMSSVAGGFEGPVDVQPDFPISADYPQRLEDMTAYMFMKMNPIWRDFEQAVPSDEDCSRLPLFALRAFFAQVSVDNDVVYPSVEEFDKVCAEPAKGMSREEFVKWVLADDPNYMESAFPKVDTGRRIQISEEDFVLDGDFQEEAPGYIVGFVDFQGNPGGEKGKFILKLAGQNA